jgi:hypothetical protein
MQGTSPANQAGPTRTAPSVPRLAETGLDIISSSLVSTDAAAWALARTPGGMRLVVIPAPGAPSAALDGVEGERRIVDGSPVLAGPTSARNAEVLRAALPWLRPQVLGLAASAGFGDRLGLATPGHARALRAAGGGIRPVFAQQSIREMTRTGRSPRQVIDDAMWGAFEAGWCAGFGADADHLKTTADAEACVAAGFTLFTIDPGEHVDGLADTASPDGVRAAWQKLPWAELETTAGATLARLAGTSFDLDGVRVQIDEGQVMRAAMKYGRAIAHILRMYRCVHAAANGRAFEFEVSVDETDTWTSHAEHIFVAVELRRLGVQWVSLAPRFVGRFEKGVDYIGDLAAFDADVRLHAAIARRFGPYKLSLHSGSDKFSIYDSVARHTRGSVHLKTAGTSYLEALRAVASVSPELFRAIYEYSRGRYDDDKASYHVSASVARSPKPADVSDADLAGLLDDFDAREILHVTFGSVLTSRRPDGTLAFADDMMALLRARPDVYAGCLERHFLRHLRPFVTA